MTAGRAVGRGAAGHGDRAAAPMIRTHGRGREALITLGPPVRHGPGPTPHPPQPRPTPRGRDHGPGPGHLRFNGDAVRPAFWIKEESPGEKSN
jgi:hypothetical protein